MPFSPHTNIAIAIVLLGISVAAILNRKNERRVIAALVALAGAVGQGLFAVGNQTNRGDIVRAGASVWLLGVILMLAAVWMGGRRGGQ